CENRFLGLSFFRRVRDFQEQITAANFEGGNVESLRGLFAPMPDRVKYTDARPAQSLTPPNAPVVLVRRRKSDRTRLDLRATLLLKPFHAIQLHEFTSEDVAQSRQVENVES